jgi:hypothetical protein
MRLAVLLVITVVTLTACSERNATIMIVEQSRDGRGLNVAIAACNGDNDVTVMEGAKTVTVTVRTDDGPGGDDCMDWVKVPLRAPLNDRRVVDGSTGNAVDVSTRPF